MANFFKEFGTGLSAYDKAVEIIFSKGLWWFFLFPYFVLSDQLADGTK
jgi:hypothetical protein